MSKTSLPRLNLILTPDLSELLNEIVREAFVSKAEVVRHALELLKAARAAKKDGHYIGAVKDRRKLDKDFVGLI